MIRSLKIPKLVRWIFSTGIIFLVLMTLLRLCLFFFFNTQGNHFSDIIPALILGMRYDLKMICILLLLILLAGSFNYLHPFRTERGKQIWLLIISISAFLFVFFYSVDFAHYSYLSQRLNASVLNYLSNASISLNMVWQTYPVIEIILVLIFGTWFVRWLVTGSYKRIKKNPLLTTRRDTIIWSIITFLLLGLGVFGRIGQFPLRWSDAFSLGSDYKANLALNPFQSFFSSLKFRHSTYDIEKTKSAFPVLAPYFGFPQERKDTMEFARTITPSNAASASMPNVVVVICESFSAYKSSMWGNPLNTTPFFDSISKKGIFFDHCFTPTYGTARGVWAVITGMPDVEIETTTSSRNPAAVDQHTIINDFEGYEKFYFLGGSASWANIRGLLINNIRGLHLYEQENYDAPKIDVWGISDKNLFLEANKVLNQESKPFFAVIQTADNHRPYTIPSEDLKEFHEKTVSADSLTQFGFESNEEMNAFRYTDFGYMKFMEAAQKEKYFDNTIFLFVGDHGIPGNAGKMFPKAWTEQRLTAEHVPLLIYAPSLLKSKRISVLCSQTDILPTLASLCNRAYRNTTLGRNILDSTYNNNKALSFIYDPDQGYIGVIKGDYLYRKQLRTRKEEMVSVVSNEPVVKNSETDSAENEMKLLAEGIYETSKYLLFHNKKKK
ncbi:MAG TPA: LTA synthase family protein [Puia sp.]|nr:LTA synthase family protein [Puia sp.]